MSRQTWVTRDAGGNVVSTTQVRSTFGCSGCFWVLLGIFVVAAPAVWATDGTIPAAVAVVMYLVEALIVVGAVVHRGRRPKQSGPD